MFVQRDQNGAVLNTWTVRQWPNQEELPDDHAEVVAALNRPGPIVCPAGRVKLELLDRKLLGQVKTLAVAMGEVGLIFLNDFRDWESSHTTVLQIGAALDPPHDAAMIRELFAAAVAREV